MTSFTRMNFDTTPATPLVGKGVAVWHLMSPRSGSELDARIVWAGYTTADGSADHNAYNQVVAEALQEITTEAESGDIGARKFLDKFAQV